MTTLRPSEVSRARNTRDIPPPPSSRSTSYALPSADWRRAGRSDMWTGLKGVGDRQAALPSGGLRNCFLHELTSEPMIWSEKDLG